MTGRGHKDEGFITLLKRLNDGPMGRVVGGSPASQENGHFTECIELMAYSLCTGLQEGSVAYLARGFLLGELQRTLLLSGLGLSLSV